METINLFFMHPRYGTTFNVAVDINLTPTEIVDNLLLSGFIPARKEGYQLALYADILPSNQPFSAIGQLQNGDILRVVERQSSSAELAIFTYVQTAQTDEIIAIQANPDWTAEQFIHVLCEKGILYEFKNDLRLYKGNQRVEMQQKLADLPLETHDLLRIVAEDYVGNTQNQPVETPAGVDNQQFNQFSRQQQELSQSLGEEIAKLREEIAGLKTQLSQKSSAEGNQFNPLISAPYQSIEELTALISNFSPQE